jgi:hypothetical protein
MTKLTTHPRLLIITGLVACLLMLFLRIGDISDWCAQSLNWREARTIELIEKDNWGLVKESIAAIESSGWLAYRFLYTTSGGDGMDGCRGRLWGLLWMALAGVCWLLFLKPLVDKERGWALLLAGLMVFASQGWPRLALALHPAAMLPVFWLAWLLYLTRMQAKQTPLGIALGCLLAAVAVHVHILFVVLIPASGALAALVLFLPLGGKNESGPFLRFYQGVRAYIIPSLCAFISVTLPLIYSHKILPLSADLITPSIGYGETYRTILSEIIVSSWPHYIIAVVVLFFALAGFYMLLRRQPRVVLCWTLGWLPFLYFPVVLRWRGESFPFGEMFALAQWIVPVFAAPAIVRLVVWLYNRSWPRRAVYACSGAVSLLVALAIFCSPGPGEPGNLDWSGLARTLNRYATENDRVLLHGPAWIYQPAQYAAIKAPFRHTPLLPNLYDMPHSPVMLHHHASESKRIWILRFFKEAWPIDVKRELKISAKKVEDLKNIRLFELDITRYRNLVSGMHTEWRPRHINLLEAGSEAGLANREFNGRDVVHLNAGQSISQKVRIAQRGIYKISVYGRNITASTGYLAVLKNDLQFHSIQVPANHENDSFESTLAFEREEATLTFKLDRRIQMLMSHIEIGRLKDNLLNEVGFQHPRRIDFGQTLRFLGYGTSSDVLRPGMLFQVSYFWQCLRTTNDPLEVVVRCDHQTADGSFFRFSNDHPFMGRMVESEEMIPSEIFKETYTIRIPKNYTEHAHKIMLGLQSARGLGTFRSDRALKPARPLVGDFNGESERIPVGMVEVCRSGVSNYILNERPRIQNPSIAAFDKSVILLGHTVFRNELSDSVQIEMILYFECKRPLRKDYSIIVKATDPDFNVVARSLHTPCDGNYPTSMWDSGQKIMDRFAFEIPFELNVDKVNLFITLEETYPKPDTEPERLGKSIMINQFSLRKKEKQK